LKISIEPNKEYGDEIEAYLESETTILPVEYYTVKWRSFEGTTLALRPRGLTTAIIDSRTIRSSSSIDYYLRQMLSDHLDPKEKANISVAYRGVKEK